MLTLLPASGMAILFLLILFRSGLPISTVLNAAVHLAIAQRGKSLGLLKAFSFDAPWKDGEAMIAKSEFAGYPTDVTSGKY
ncbi:hypothetical protein OIHEL45_19606 [Sulfitobacter indolifex HEL-45]|uniref:Uncharacterized protein n=1 Tax=Sulfitobacter indolifex HEL-45 TaxID=391624 RepID=A0ABP2D5M8_9RHOB|nr:hypothetical protein OIHEL45_19606 [Sulfitobacter indolifex HEL-45]